MKGLIHDDQEFLQHKESLDNERRHIRAVLSDMARVDLESTVEVKKAFNLCVSLSEVFKTGTFDEKQEALSVLGSNLTLKSKILSICNRELFVLIEKGLRNAVAENDWFEPGKYVVNKGQNGTFVLVCPALCRMVDEVRTYAFRKRTSPPDANLEARLFPKDS
jgi:hypothetical protein